MTHTVKQGVFICQGGQPQPESLELKRLRWAAEAGMRGPVVEVTRACQADGAAHIVRQVTELGLDAFILGACPLASPAGVLGRALVERGLDPGIMQVLDVCRKPQGGLGPCQVDGAAESALCLALAARADEEEVADEVVTVSTAVLIIGDGVVALWLASDLADRGYQVVLLTPTRRLAPPQQLLGPEAAERARELAAALQESGQVRLVRGGRLLGLAGTAGDFTARLKDREGESFSLAVGAVVLCQGPPPRPNLGELELPPSRWLTLREMIALVDSPAHLEKRLDGNQAPAVGLLVGLGDESDPQSLRAALEVGLRVIDMGGQATLFTGNAKVAAGDLERQMQAAREAGMLQVKFTGHLPAIKDQDGKLVVRYLEEVLGREIVQELDLLAVDETPSPDQEFQDLVRALGLEPGRDGSPQTDRMAAQPIYTSRGGVLAIGPAALGGDLVSQMDQASEAAWSIARLLGSGRVEAPVGLVKVDRRRCAICLTCVRVCPEGAMSKHDRRPFYNPLVCTACGTCAAECPMDAIQIVGQEDSRYHAQIETVATRSQETVEPGAPEMMVFLCANSGGGALAEARLAGMDLPDGLHLVQVPCAGKLDPAMVLDAFTQGIDGVMVISCHPGACYSLQGGEWAGMRVAHLGRLLQEAGHDPARLKLTTVQANQPGELVAALTRAMAELGRLGDNPLKTAARVRRMLGRYTVETDDCYTLL